MSFDDICYKKAWADFDENETFPARRPLLAHYTSVSTLEGILRTNEFWLSHPLLMNDHQEMKWGLLEGQKQFLAHEGIAAACGTTERHQELVKAFSTCFDEFATSSSYDVYVGCFCKHDENDGDRLLSMWRAYGANGGGVSVVFDTARLIAMEESPFILAPVDYASDEDRRRWIERKLDEVAIAIRDHLPPDRDLPHAARHFFNRLKYFSLFTKHCGFREEQEWRVVYMEDRDTNGEYEKFFTYQVSDKGIHPKMKLPLDEGLSGGASVSLATLIKRILLGPTAGEPLSLMAIRRMAAKLGKPELADVVQASTTPLRG